MKINKIIVENYRSIKKVELEPSKFSVFVGQNNHGKTNLFEAIQWFYSAKSTSKDEKHSKDDNNIVSVELFFDDVVENDISKLKTEANQTKIRNLLGENTTFSIIKKSTDHKRKYIVNGEDKGNPSGLDTAINEFIPALEYVNTKIRLDDVSKYKDKNPIGQMLSGVMGKIIETSKEYIAFQQKFSALFENEQSEIRVKLNELGQKVQIYLEKQFPDGTKVKFEVNPPQFTDLLKSFDTSVDDGIETKAEDKGDGMQRAIMLSIIQAYADFRKEDIGGGSFLFLIDEAELHLHPSAQRALKKALLDIASSEDQVLINTHSSVFVADDHELQITYKVNKKDKITNIEKSSELDRVDVIFELLGGSPADLLLPRNFLITEGKSEFVFIKKIIERFYPEIYKGIKILFSGGDITKQERGIIAVDEIFRPLVGNDNPIYKNKTVILIDKPNDEQQNTYNSFKQGYPYLFNNSQVFELPENSLEQYYPDNWKKEPEEVNAMNGGKVKYAEKVATEITKEKFENDMSIIFEAMKKCNDLAFNPQGNENDA
jgi:recombinational DNA repair ATPase RecF